MKRITHWLLTLLMVVICSASSAANKPSLCFITNWCNGEQEDVPLVAELRKHGFYVDNVEFHKLTAEKMKEYNAIIFPEFPMKDPFQKNDCNWKVKPESLIPFYKAIEEYVKNGGGVVVYGVCFFQTHLNGMGNMNVMLKPWGAETLYEQVMDPDRLFKYRKQYGYDYSWSNNLTKHKLTDGLKTIFYTRSQQHGPTTCTFKLSKDWEVLLRGEKSAFSVDGGKFRQNTNYQQKKTYSSEPPIIAIRKYGKGRIGLIGVTPVMSVFAARFVGHGNVLLDEGNGTTKSDFGKLQERVYKWVSEPASKTGKPGGFAGKPVKFTVRADLKSPIMDWKKFKPGQTGIKPLKGMIGARTSLTGGKGTVKEYAIAAKEAGHDFIGFSEDFTKLTPQKWEKFKKDCEAVSTDKFLAVPGFIFQDNVDADWFALGSFKFPYKKLLSKDGKKIIEPDWWFKMRNPLIGPINVNKGPRPFWDFALYGGIAVESFKNGKLTDKAFDAYLDRCEVENLLAPLVINLIDSPEQVKSGKNLVSGGLFPSIAVLKAKINRIMGNKNMFFASTGPILTDWRSWNQGRTTQGRRISIPGTEQMAVHFAIRSDKPLKNVKLMDGPHVLRNFSGNDKKKFAQTVIIPHDRQRHLVVMAEDIDGGKLISGQFATTDQLNWRFMCADNGNSICDSVLRTPRGRVYITGPVAPYQRTTTMFSFTPGITELSSKFAAPYVDGGVRMVPHNSTPWLAIKGVKFKEGKLKSKMVHPLSSRDVIIQQNDLIGWSDHPHAHPWAPARKIKELKDYKTVIRWIDFAKRDGDPGFTLVEGTITFLRDLELDKQYSFNPRIDQMHIHSTDYTCPAYSLTGIEGFEGNSLCGVTQKGKKIRYEGPLKAGGFVALFPYYSGAGAVLPLDDGLQIRSNFDRPTTRVETGFNYGGRKFKKGDKLKYRLLVGRGKIGAKPTDQEWRDFVSKMGLSGKPGYSVKMIQGKLLSTKYIMATEAIDNGITVKIDKANLPVMLPITITKINPRITAGIVSLKDDFYMPVGVMETESKIYTVWDTSKADSELYIGNLVSCNSRELIITVTKKGTEWVVDVHNPTTKKIKAQIKGIKQEKTLAKLIKQVEVLPGQSIVLNQF